MTWHIYSTLSAPTMYVTYKKNDPREMSIAEHRITIAGGANVSNKHFVTPRGVVTKVTDEDYQHLINNSVFQKHMEAGHILCDQIKSNPNKVADASMEAKDASAPLTPTDKRFDNKGRGTGVKVRDDSKGNMGKK